MCLNNWTPKTINFPFETNRKLMVLGVPILKPLKVTLELQFLTIVGIMDRSLLGPATHASPMLYSPPVSVL